ncbi:MAG: hypothetical protein WBP81_06580 [Solirubrobacteraceae bacterium]
MCEYEDHGDLVSERADNLDVVILNPGLSGIDAVPEDMNQVV